MVVFGRISLAIYSYFWPRLHGTNRRSGRRGDRDSSGGELGLQA